MSGRSIRKKDRWSSGMDLLNLIAPASVPHKGLVQMSHAAGLPNFKFKPWSVEFDDASRPWCVRDIIEFLTFKVRVVMFEDEKGDHCAAYFELLGEGRESVQTFKFEMRAL